MQRPTLLEGILVALVVSLAASPVVFVLSLLLGPAMAGKAVIVVIAYAYIVYLLAQSGRTDGRTTLAVLSLLALLASVVLEARWTAVVLVAVELLSAPGVICVCPSSPSAAASGEWGGRRWTGGGWLCAGTPGGAESTWQVAPTGG